MDIKKLPKIDLHCHLDGSLRLDLIQKYVERPVTWEMLSAPEDCRSLTEYLEKFDLPLQCMQDEAGLTESEYSFVRDESLIMKLLENAAKTAFDPEAGIAALK